MILPMDCGPQPLDALMTRLNISNHDLVAASTDQLTHKMVAKGRKGRRLTLNAQKKILNALNRAQTGRKYVLEDLFGYLGTG